MSSSIYNIPLTQAEMKAPSLGMVDSRHLAPDFTDPHFLTTTGSGAPGGKSSKISVSTKICRHSLDSDLKQDVWPSAQVTSWPRSEELVQVPPVPWPHSQHCRPENGD